MSQAMGFENDRPVPIVEPDFSSIDSLEDWVKEEMAAGRRLAEIIETLCHKQLNEQKWESIGAALLCVIDSAKPRLTARQLMWASGILSEGNISGPDIAKKHGVTKQAVQQGVKRITELLNLPLTSFMRKVESREKMKKANFRKPKSK